MNKACHWFGPGPGTQVDAPRQRRSVPAPGRHALALLAGCVCLWGWSAAGEQLRALVVGIDQYKVFGALKYGSADATAVAQTLIKKGACAPADVALLTDTAATAPQRPTLTRLREEVERLAGKAAAGDTLLFFFSGHGISAGEKGDGYLVPLEGIAEGTLSLRWVKETLGKSKAAGALLLLDVCHKGSTAQGVVKVTPDLATAQFLIITSTSGPDEYSFDDDTAGHTLFTRALLEFTERWSGKNRVSAADLYRALDDRIHELTLQTPRRQQPFLAGPTPEKLAVFLPAGGAGVDVAPEEAALQPVQGRPWQVPELGLELVPVAPGQFKMGSKHGDLDEGNVHRVTLTRGFWIGKYEVTQAEYKAIMGVNPSRTKSPRLPVQKVDWRDAVEFCQRVTATEKGAKRLPAGYVYRLPTEAEWEYACRAGSDNEYSFGDDPKELAQYGNFTPVDPRTGKRLSEEDMPDDGIDGPAPVGRFKPSKWGIYDMHGNVWEWCLDFYEPYPTGDVTDYAGPAGGFFHTARGGGWADAALHARSASRAGATAEYVSNGLGFRVVLGPEIVRDAPVPPAPEIKPWVP